MLFNQYVAANPTLTAEVVQFVKDAVTADIATCHKKIAETQVDQEKSEAERIGEAKLLEKRIENATEVLKKEGSDLFKIGSPSKPLLDLTIDAVSVTLDSKLKGETCFDEKEKKNSFSETLL